MAANVNHYYNFGNFGIPAAPAMPDPNAWMWGAPAPEAPAIGPPPPPPLPLAPAAAAPPPQWAAILGNGNPPVPAAAAPAPPPAPVVQPMNAPPPPPPPAPAMPVMQPQGAAQWAAIQAPGDAAPVAGPDWFISPAQGGFQAPAPVAAAQNMAGFYVNLP